MESRSVFFKVIKKSQPLVILIFLWFLPVASHGETQISCEAENKKYIFCFLGDLNAWGKVRQNRNFLISWADKSTESRDPWGDVTWDTNHAGPGTTTPRYLRRQGHLTGQQFFLDIAYPVSETDHMTGKVYSFQESVEIVYDRKSQTGFADLWMSTRYNKPPVNIRLNKIKCSFNFRPPVDCRLPSW